MRTLTIMAALGACLAMAACSKPTQEKTSEDLKAIGSDAATAAKDVAHAPAVKELGADIKQGTQEAAAKTKAATDEAGAKLEASAKDAGAKLKAGAKDAGAKTDAALNKAKDKAQN
jgi:hypothetical protein